MIQLTVYNPSNEGQILELYPNESINLTYQFKDIIDLNKLGSNFSKTFRIPFTDVNAQFFGEIGDPNIIPDWFDPKKKIPCTLTHDTVPIMEGFVKVTNIYHQKGKYHDLEINVFGETANFSKSLGDLKLKDISTLPTLNQTVNWANVQASWVGDQDLRYGLCDRGKRWNTGNWDGYTNPNYDNPIYAGMFTPMVRLKYLMDGIANDAGFTIDSSWLTNETDTYIPFLNNTESIITDEVPMGQVFKAVIQSNTNYLSATTDQQVINQTDSTLGGFDTGANYTIGVPSFYTCPYNADYTIKVKMSFNVISTSFPFYPVVFKVRKVGTTNIVWSSEYVVFSGDNQFPGSGYEYDCILNETFTTTLATGEQLELIVNLPQYYTTIIYGGASTTSYWECQAITNPFDSFTMQTELNAPDMSQIDFMKACQKLFNLVIIQDRNNPFKLYLEPFNDYMATAAVVNWTDLLDISKDQTLKMGADLEKKRLEFTYTKDGDKYNKKWQDSRGWTFGRKLIDETNNDFATSDLKVTTLFSPTPLWYIYGTEVFIPKFLKDDGTLSDVNTRILYWGGMEDVGGNSVYAFDDGTALPTLISQYPHFSHYSTRYPTVTDNDLNFGKETPFQWIYGEPTNTAYARYWRDYIVSLHSSESRILTAYFKLDSIDVSQFQWNDNIWVKDSYWRINKMTYVPSHDGTTKVELIKLIDEARSCEYLPTGQNDDGQITFTDSAGTSGLAGNQECCEAADGTWDSAAGTCLAYGLPISPDLPPNRSQDIGSDNSNGAIRSSNTGCANELTPDAQFSGIVGLYNILKKKASQILGINADGYHHGWMLGGGVYDGDGDQERGRAQHGKIMQLAEGDLETIDNVIEFCEVGETTLFLDMPNNSTHATDITISLQERNPATGFLVGWLRMRVELLIWKTNNIAAFQAGFVQQEQGTLAGQFTFGVDVVTNTAEHRFNLTASGGSLPTYDVVATALVNYVQVNEA